MASRVLVSLAGRAARSSSSPAAAATVGVGLCRAASFTTAVNNGDPAPATGSEEDKGRKWTTGGGDGPPPVGRAAADVGRKAKGAAEEVKEAGREVKDRAKEVGQDVKETIKHTH